MDKRMDNLSIIVDAVLSPVPGHILTVGGEPSRHVGRIEADEVTDLDKGDPPLGDESPKVPLGRTRRPRDFFQSEKLGQLGRRCFRILLTPALP